MVRQREHDGWMVRESGPSDARHRLLLLPGGMCTAAFYEDVEAEPSLNEAAIGFVSTTLPGQGGAPRFDDLSIENIAARAGRLAADFRCDAVVGHSIGANVALEMAAAGQFDGPLVLLSPSFSRRDEYMILRVLDRMAGVFGDLPFAAMKTLMARFMKGEVPPHRRAALFAEMMKNDPRAVRESARLYLSHLDRHGSLARRLCDSGVRAWTVFGEKRDVGLTAEERRLLDECPSVTMVQIAGAGHMALNQKPERIARVILDAMSATTPT